MESKKINQLATNVAPVASDLTIVGDPTTGVSKKVTLSQIASLFAGAVDFYTNLAAFPATGVLNTIYCAKDTQKLYLWSGSAYVETFPSQSVLNTYQLLSEKGVSNGYASLDSGGKVPIAQLPSSIMEYKGLWSAATNTPTLANGTGDTGDVYICSAAGSVNFGAGAITFAVGDYVIYSGSIWQRSSGAVGTVTSVGLSSATSGVTIGSSPITTSGTITLAIATATTSQNGLLSSTDWALFNGKESVLTFSSPLVRTTNTISIPAATTSVNGYLASADFTTFNNKQNAITLTTTGTSGVATFVGATLNIPNYGSVLTGYVPYTGATQDVDLDTFKLNAQSIHAKGTGGLGHLGLKHQSASATASANEVSLFADSLGDLAWLNGNLYLSKFIISGNTAARSYTFPNANGTVALTSDLANYVDLTTAQTIGGTKTFSDATKNNGGIFLQNASSSSLAGYMNIGGLTNGVKFTSGGGVSNTFTLPSATGYTFTFPNATGTLALTSDISYPVTSVFGRTGAVVATSGDYTTAQVTEVTNLYFTDSRARLALSFVAGSGAYNNTTGVITIPTNNNQITNGAGYTTNVGTVTSVAATGGTGISITGSPITTSGTITITNTAPDQTVSLTASTGISVTGTYPNFTITNTSPSSGGTVTSVAALTIGTTGTDLSSSVANSTTTPVITLNVPTASATNRGALSAADFTTFNNKQGTITLTTTGTSGAATFSANTLNIPNYGSALSGYLPLTGGTLTGALGGTSASFTSNLTINNAATSGKLNIQTANDNGLYIYNGSSASRFMFNNYFGFSIDAMFLQEWNTSNVFQRNVMTFFTGGNVGVGTGGTDSGYKLDVNGTGRFSGQLSADGGVSSSNEYTSIRGNNTRIFYSGSATTGYQYMALLNTTAYTIFGIEGTTAGSLLTNGTAYASVLTSVGNTNLEFGTNQVKRLTIAASTGAATFSSGIATFGYTASTSYAALFNGSVGIGTASPGVSLDVSGSGIRITNATPNVYFNNNTVQWKAYLPTSTNNFAINDAVRDVLTLGYNGAASYFQGCNVGIGTSTFNYASAGRGYLALAGSTDSLLEFQNSGTNASGYIFGTSTYLKIQISGAKKLVLNSDGGNVLIGTETDATGKLQVNGTIYATGFYESSDIRFKNILETNPNVNVLGIDVIKFTRKDNDTNQVRYGYSAQQVQSILPDAVTGTDFLNVNYLDVHTLKIAQLEKEIKELKAKLN